MLEIDGLTKVYEGRTVLSGVHLDVRAGESLALLGANGTGKSTTLRAVAGLVLPDAGSLLVDGVDARRFPKIARSRLSFLPQKSCFPGTLTARETLEVVARLRGVPGSRVQEEIEACLLSEVADRSVATLSGGERQRLGLAVAFLPEVGLYLFDEPSANLDATSSRVFSQRARGLVDDGRAVLFTTHVDADVAALATRAVELRDGRCFPRLAGIAGGRLPRSAVSAEAGR